VGAAFTAACLSGFLQGFVLFLALPLDLGAPFGGLAVVGGVIAVGLWLFVLHLVVLVGWLLTQSLDELLARRSTATAGLARRPAGHDRAIPGLGGAGQRRRAFLRRRHRWLGAGRRHRRG
jgi:hypothetical protein